MPKLGFDFKTKFLNGASLALVLVIGFTLGLAIFRTSNFEAFKQKNQTIEIRIIGKNVDTFNREIWYGWYNFGLWQIQSNSRLDIGYQYSFEGEITTFGKSENFELYNLSTGLVGKIKVNQNLLKNTVCNFTCLMVQNIYTTKSQAQISYLRASCQTFWPIIKNIQNEINCSDVAGLSIGLVLGGTDYFSSQLKDDFKKTGLMHIVAVSGFQIGLIMSLVEFLVRRSRIPRNLRILIFSLILGFFIFLFGPEPPVIRSSLSFLISSSCLIIFGRSINGLRALIYSGGFMLLVNPFYLFSISFQLSFIASFALIVSFDRDLFEFKHLANFWNLASSTVAAFLYTLPILVSIGGNISLIAVVTNILVIPIIPFLTGLNILGLIPFIGDFFVMLALIIQAIFISIIQVLSRLLPTITFDKFSSFEMLIYYFLISLLFLSLPKIIAFLKNRQKLNQNSDQEPAPKSLKN